MEDLEKLVKQNIEYTKEVHAMVIKIRKYIIWQQVLNIVKIVIILIPIILAIVYALPIIGQAMGQYSAVMDQLNNVSGIGGVNSANQLLEGLLNK